MIFKARWYVVRGDFSRTLLELTNVHRETWQTELHPGCRDRQGIP
jgi:hypothetical protein